MSGPRPSRSQRLPAAAAGLVLLLSGCSGPTAAPTPPSATTAPLGLEASVDHTRIHRLGRTIDVRLEAGATQGVRVTRVEIASSRVDGAVWTGAEDLDPVAQLAVELPPGHCGGDPGFELALTYSVDGGAERLSTVPATDLYGAVSRLLDRDCAASVLAEAATLETGELRVVGGDGPDGVLELPVALTPTGRRDDVVVRGFEDTVLFAQAPGSASAVDGRTRVRLDGTPVTLAPACGAGPVRSARAGRGQGRHALPDRARGSRGRPGRAALPPADRRRPGSAAAVRPVLLRVVSGRVVGRPLSGASWPPSSPRAAADPPCTPRRPPRWWVPNRRTASAATRRPPGARTPGRPGCSAPASAPCGS